MSQWCDTCSLGKVNGRYESCTKNCPAFGKTYEELAEIVIRQREEIDALRWTNKQLIKVEKEKRRELWDKINKIKEILSEKSSVADSQEFGLHYGQIDDYLDQIEKVINHIKE